MKRFHRQRRRSPRAAATSRLKDQAGVTLIETVVATGLLLVALAGLVSVSFVATTSTENQGHLSARTTEYAQDKMEQLLALAYGDLQSDTTQFPATNAGGTGLAVGGSLNPAAPANGYVDYLDVNGNLLGGGAAPATWYYKRVWKVEFPPGTANLKQITVATIVKWSLGGTQQPTSTVTALKTFPF
jgi:hypothetical protein